VAGFVFEDVSTAWEIDLWPRWDDSPWIDGGQRIDIQATEHEVLEAAPLGDRPTVVVSQDTYDEEGIPGWAAPIFARQQAKLAALGEDAIHVRADGGPGTGSIWTLPRSWSPRSVRWSGPLGRGPRFPTAPRCSRPPKQRPIGRDKGKIWVSPDFDDPLPWQIFPGFPYE
jgi:hypothetical protein